MSRFPISFLTFSLILTVLFLNCEKEAVNITNLPPQIIKMVAVPLDVIPEGKATLTVFGTDPEGDEITFRWSATGGFFSADTGSSVTWNAPDSVNDYIITVVAHDEETTDTASVIIRVQMIFGKLTVTSDPDSAEIILDDENTGKKTPHTFNQILIGEHVVKVVKQGFSSQPDSSVVNILENTTTEVSFSLSQNFGRLKVTSDTVSANIILDGQDTGERTPHTFEQVLEGEHVVKVYKQGYAAVPDSIVVTVVKDQTAQANFTFAQDFGSLRVTSNPDQAEILLDGQSTGETTPHIFTQVSVGDHVVKVEKQNFIPDQDSLIVTVSGGDTVDANFTMTQAAAVQGNTYFASTTIPITDVVVSVQNNKDTTDSSGYYLVDQIAPGTQTLTAAKPDFDTYNEVINLSPGMMLDKTIEMTSSVFTHTIFGQITNSLGQHINGVMVTVLNPDGSPSGLTDISTNNGNYQIEQVPQGNRQIRFAHQYFEDRVINANVSATNNIFDVQMTALPIDPPMNLTLQHDWNVISLDWDPVSVPTLAGYNVYRSQDQFSGYEKVNSTLITTNTFQDVIDTLTIPSSYYYKVSSVNIDGVEGNLSDFAEYSTPTSWNGTAAWNGIFRLIEDFTVGVNNTLIIESGSQILLKTSRRIFVQGQLFANGMQNQPIHFLPFSGSDLDIKFISGSPGGFFDHCMIEGNGSFDVNIASPDSVEIMNSTFMPVATGDTALTMNVLNGRLNIKNCILNSVKGINVGVGVMNDTYLKMTNSALFNSESGILGGTVSIETVILRNNLFISNGQSVKLPGPEAEANIDHNVFAKNPGIFSNQLGIAIDYWTQTQEVHDWDITNNIIIENNIGIFNFGSGTNSHSIQDYNDVWNNTINYGGNLTNPGPNSISDDPLFINPDYTNPLNGDWNLQGGSPCIGSGSNGTDIGLLDPNNIGPQ